MHSVFLFSGKIELKYEIRIRYAEQDISTTFYLHIFICSILKDIWYQISSLTYNGIFVGKKLKSKQLDVGPWALGGILDYDHYFLW